MSEDNNRPKGWGKKGPPPKKLVEATIVGLEVGRGDNKNVVPPDQVEELASIGCTDREIATFFGIKEDTLRRNFADNLAKGREFQKTRLRRLMFKAADNLNPAILIFLSKNILGMTDQPMQSEANEPLPWTDEEVDAVQEKMDELELDNEDE